MPNNIIAELDKEQHDALAARANHPDFTHGDTVKVWVKVREGEKERLQAYEGVVIARTGHGLNESFTVRKISYGEGVERVFPVLSPNVDRVEAAGELREEARQLLADTGLFALLADRFGEPMVTGSAAYDLMVWRDIDIDLPVEPNLWREWMVFGSDLAAQLDAVGLTLNRA